MHKRIRIARGTNERIATLSETLPEGQPLYNKDKGYLTIGSTDASGNLLNVSQCPIKVRELKGWYDDATSAGTNISTTNNTNFFYFGQDYNSANTRTVARGIKYLDLRVNTDTFITLDNNSSKKGIYINKPIKNEITIDATTNTQTINSYTIKPRSDITYNIGTSSLRYQNAYIHTLNSSFVQGSIAVEAGRLDLINYEYTVGSSTNNSSIIIAYHADGSYIGVPASIKVGNTVINDTNIVTTDISVTNVLTDVNTKNITSEHIYNKTNNTYDIGSSSNKFRTAYVNTLNVNTINLIT